jgi:tripeptide aminopeptidase
MLTHLKMKILMSRKKNKQKRTNGSTNNSKQSKQLSMGYYGYYDTSKEAHNKERKSMKIKTFDKQLLKDVLSVQTASRKDTLMRRFIKKFVNQLPSNGSVVRMTEDKGNIYITKSDGKSDTFPCVVAHMDTVHDIHKSFIVYDNAYTRCFFAMNEANTQVGVGGDDKVGIYIALQALKTMPNIKIVFFRDEEVGCLGSGDADMIYFSDCRFVLQCDRRGNDEVITNGSSTGLMSKKFQEDIKIFMNRYGYKFSDRGSITDVVELKNKGLEISVANLGCGYYEPHTDNEIVDYIDVEYVWGLVLSILDLEKTYVHVNSKNTKEIFNDYWEDDSYGGEIQSVEKDERREFSLNIVDFEGNAGMLRLTHTGYEDTYWQPVYKMDNHKCDCGSDHFFSEYYTLRCFECGEDIIYDLDPIQVCDETQNEADLLG